MRLICFIGTVMMIKEEEEDGIVRIILSDADSDISFLRVYVLSHYIPESDKWGRGVTTDSDVRF